VYGNSKPGDSHDNRRGLHAKHIFVNLDTRVEALGISIVRMDRIRHQMEAKKILRFADRHPGNDLDSIWPSQSTAILSKITEAARTRHYTGAVAPREYKNFAIPPDWYKQRVRRCITHRVINQKLV
jgi:hypothetical protein